MLYLVFADGQLHGGGEDLRAAQDAGAQAIAEMGCKEVVIAAVQGDIVAEWNHEDAQRHIEAVVKENRRRQ